MILAVKITKVETGETRTYTTEVDPQYVDNQPYMWREGNYSCDCNRELFWHRAAGEDDPDIDEQQCGDDKRYTIERMAELDGKPFDLGEVV